MSAPTQRDFTAAERTQLRDLLTARRRQALFGSIVAAVLTLLFCARMLLGHIKRGDEWIIYLLVAAVVLSIGAIVAFPVCGPVRNLGADLDAGTATLLEGPISKIVAVDNKFGDTLTYAFVGETRVYSPDALFEGLKDGDRVRVFTAARAHVALTVEKVG